MSAPHRRSLGLLAACLVASGCASKAVVTAVHRPATATTAAALTGTVKVLIDGASIISDNGGGLLTDNGAAIVSNTGGNLLTDNGAAIVSNNGSGLVGENGGGVVSNQGARRRLLAAATTTAREVWLADAQISLEDAGGAAVLDASGKPVIAVSDHTGHYTLPASAAAKNTVLHVVLHNGGALHGGDLRALLPQGTGAADRPINTATTLGATYVLDQFVHGSQSVFDKLPASEAAKLDTDLAGVQGQITLAPSYQAGALVSLTDALRAKAPAVGQELDAIKALLLGQSNLGDGLAATQVPLVQPEGLVIDSKGNIYFGESSAGRIREITPDNTLLTFADGVRGSVKSNFLLLADMSRGTDGSIDVVSAELVDRITPDGQVTPIAGNGVLPSAEPTDGAKALTTPVKPVSVAAGPDGLTYFGTDLGLYMVDATGAIRAVSLGQPEPLHTVQMAVLPDGTLYALAGPGLTDDCHLYRLKPGQAAEQLPTDYPGGSGLAVAPDGTVYVAQLSPPAITALAPNGTTRIVAGTGAVVAGTNAVAVRALVAPHALAVAPDGTLVVIDRGPSLIYALSPKGEWKLLAGIPPGTALGDDPGELALDAPGGVAFDAGGNLVILTTGDHRVSRFDGSHLTTIVGTQQGFAGDGGPATAARLDSPAALAIQNGVMTILDAGNGRLRRVGTDGIIQTLLGGSSNTIFLSPGQRSAPADFGVRAGGLAIDPHGRPYWAGSGQGLYREAADGDIEPVTLGGPPSTSNQTAGLGSLLAGDRGDGQPAANVRLGYPWGLAFDAHGDLYVADAEGFCIRKIGGLDTATPTISTFAGAAPAVLAGKLLGGTLGSEEGIQAKDAVFAVPIALAFDAAGNMYVLEIGTTSLESSTFFTAATVGIDPSLLPKLPARVRRISPDGTIRTVVGPEGRLLTDPLAVDALVTPYGLAVSADGRLAIADAGTNMVHLFPAGSF